MDTGDDASFKGARRHSTGTTARGKIDRVDTTENEREGKRVETTRKLTTETLVCSATAGVAEDGGNRR